MQPDWYRERIYGKHHLPDTPEQRGCCRTTDIVKGLSQRYKYGLVTVKLNSKDDGNRATYHKRINEGLYTLVKVVTCGRHYRMILACTRKNIEAQLTRKKLELAKLKDLLK